MTSVSLSPPSLSLAGKTALVTGGTRGIGAATAQALAELGATVTVVARDRAIMNKQIDAWQELGLKINGVCADLAVLEDCEQLIPRLSLSTLDILVNNVGTNVRRKALEYSHSEYANIMNTNLNSAWALSRLAYPLLRASNGAAVVNVSSVAGRSYLGTGVPYAMSKAAMTQMTRGLAVEWAVDAIRVNAVAPWYTDTPLARSVLDNADYHAAVVQRTPLGRVASAREVACAIAFLCSPCASFITGQCLAVDGGFSASGFDAAQP